MTDPRNAGGCECPGDHTADSRRARSRAQKRFMLLVTLGAAGLLAVWWVREPLRRFISEQATLANDAPSADVVEEMIAQAANPRATLLAAWDSGKIVQREVAIRNFTQVVPAEAALPRDLAPLLLSAALDPDINVRELALTILQQRNHPDLPALAAEQLKDCDLEVRWLGLDHLKSARPQVGVPTVIPLLDDPDPFIVGLSLKLLERWSGQEFGVKISETVPIENEKTGLKEYRPGSSEKARAGAQRAKAWWSGHQSEFPPVQLQAPVEAYSARRALPARNFRLQSLDGQKIELSDLRGKVVLLNFWTTWCPACLSEMPELIALGKQHQDNLVILGVSLDVTADEHGHGADPAAAQNQGGNRRTADAQAGGAEATQRVRERVTRFVKSRGLNYPILLDEHNEAGGRYNGGELPTTVIVDRQGNIRRRFTGARSLAVFEAMIAEAAQPR